MRESIKEKLNHSAEWTTEMASELIAGKRALDFMADDMHYAIRDLQRNFPEVVQVGSIGKSFLKRDIPLLTVGLPGKLPLSERPALMLTGAHHAREATSVAMCFQSLYRILHKLEHGDQETINMLKTQTLYIIPAVNIDGWSTVQNVATNMGTESMKRKNENPTYGGMDVCKDHDK